LVTVLEEVVVPPPVTAADPADGDADASVGDGSDEPGARDSVADDDAVEPAAPLPSVAEVDSDGGDGGDDSAADGADDVVESTGRATATAVRRNSDPSAMASRGAVAADVFAPARAPVASAVVASASAAVPAVVAAARRGSFSAVGSARPPRLVGIASTPGGEHVAVLQALSTRSGGKPRNKRSLKRMHSAGHVSNPLCGGGGGGDAGPAPATKEQCVVM
jgi:hypothetical protein